MKWRGFCFIWSNPNTERNLKSLPSKSLQGFNTSLSLIFCGSLIIAMSPSVSNVLLNQLSCTKTFEVFSLAVFLWSVGTLKKNDIIYLKLFFFLKTNSKSVCFFGSSTVPSRKKKQKNCTAKFGFKICFQELLPQIRLGYVNFFCQPFTIGHFQKANVVCVFILRKLII